MVGSKGQRFQLFTPKLTSYSRAPPSLKMRHGSPFSRERRLAVSPHIWSHRLPIASKGQRNIDQTTGDYNLLNPSLHYQIRCARGQLESVIRVAHHTHLNSLAVVNLVALLDNHFGSCLLTQSLSSLESLSLSESRMMIRSRKSYRPMMKVLSGASTTKPALA